jgi:hypothetical protein
MDAAASSDFLDQSRDDKAPLARGFFMSMIRKSVQRFSEKIMLKQNDKAGWLFEEKSSRFRRRPTSNDGGASSGDANGGGGDASPNAGGASPSAGDAIPNGGGPSHDDGRGPSRDDGRGPSAPLPA